MSTSTLLILLGVLNLLMGLFAGMVVPPSMNGTNLSIRFFLGGAFYLLIAYFIRRDWKWGILVGTAIAAFEMYLLYQSGVLSLDTPIPLILKGIVLLLLIQSVFVAFAQTSRPRTR